MHQFAIEKKSGTIGQALCQLPNDVARKKDIPANMLLFIYDDTLLHKSKMFMKKKKNFSQAASPENEKPLPYFLLRQCQIRKVVAVLKKKQSVLPILYTYSVCLQLELSNKGENCRLFEVQLQAQFF